ncbi:MAG: FecR domain-containing protein, partial [Planctomycetia bacterium]|nr:FecR domain-containing protein [Planctomycetia bacterium]
MNPNNPYDSEVLEWVNRYLQNDFDPEMEIALAERSLKDPGIVKCLLDNLDMDRLIRCWQRRNCPGPFPVYHAKHREGSDEDSLLIGDFLPVSFDQFDPELNTTIVRQDPVDFEVLQPSFRTDLKKILRALWSKNTLKYLTPILLLFGAMIWGLWGILHCNDPDSLHEYAPIARVADLIDPVWAEGEETFKPGQEFGPNKLFLRSGWARIQFLNGNEVILKGNTDLIVNDEKSLFCNQGDLAVTVSSQGKDLEIITPFARVIDRGTRFSL